MACYHPLKGFQIGLTKNNKPQYKICSYDTQYVFSFLGDKDEKWYSSTSEYSFRPGVKTITEFTEIPCGQCIGCRLDYSRQWATRCMLEAQYHEQSYFVTLTYDDVNVPWHLYCGNDDKLHISYSLEKRDFQLFIKRLRKNLSYKYKDIHEPKIRFFASGEYGSKTARPHYHAIIFGLKLDDLQLYKNDVVNGWKYYNSPFLDKAWQHKGHVVVTDVNWETCAYVARYVMKKQKGESAFVYDAFNITPEFSLMSRKPGIARQYYDDHPDIYDFDEIYYSTKDGGKKTRPPRYFDKIYESTFPELFEYVKANRKEVSEAIREMKLKQTSLSYEDLLLVEERKKETQLSKLKRTSI